MNGKIISGPAAVLLIAFFFFPWIMVSCQGTVLGEISGYQLAAGVAPESMAGVLSADEMQAEPILFAVPLTGVVVLILLGVTLWKADFEQNAAWGQIVATAATGLILIMEWLQMRQNSDPMIEVSPLPAFWGSLIALVAVAAGAILDLVLRQRTRAPASTAPPANFQKQSFPAKPDFPQAMPPPRQTAVPEEAPDFYGPSRETIVDEDPSAMPGSYGLSQETIVGDDLSTPPGFGQETIVDDDFGGDRGTVVKTEVLYDRPDVSAKLIVEEGNEKGRQFLLSDNTTIGRVQDNGIVIDDTAMSSYHARISEENGRFYIHDMNSTNGVYILKAAQTRWEQQDKCELADGDKIKLGRTTLLFSQ